MSVENVKKFRNDLEGNTELKEKVKSELENFKDSEKNERDFIPEIARKLGYDFTDEEFKNASKELSDDELANVSGGVWGFGDDAPDGHEIGCMLFYYRNWRGYYYGNNICEKCKSTNTHRSKDADQVDIVVCNVCGHITENPFTAPSGIYREVEGPKIGPING